jgi:hypothetical protein
MSAYQVDNTKATSGCSTTILQSPVLVFLLNCAFCVKPNFCFNNNNAVRGRQQ